MAIDYYQQQFGEDVFEGDEPEAAAPAAPSDEQILAFVQANIDNPALIEETAAQYGVSVADFRAMTTWGRSQTMKKAKAIKAAKEAA